MAGLSGFGEFAACRAGPSCCSSPARPVPKGRPPAPRPPPGPPPGLRPMRAAGPSPCRGLPQAPASSGPQRRGCAPPWVNRCCAATKAPPRFGSTRAGAASWMSSSTAAKRLPVWPISRRVPAAFSSGARPAASGTSPPRRRRPFPHLHQTPRRPEFRRPEFRPWMRRYRPPGQPLPGQSLPCRHLPRQRSRCRPAPGPTSKPEPRPSL
jgi:hypothetical protein